MPTTSDRLEHARGCLENALGPDEEDLWSHIKNAKNILDHELEEDGPGRPPRPSDAMTPDDAKEILVQKYGYDEDDIVAGGNFITVFGNPDANHPLGGVLYSINRIGWRVTSIDENDDGVPFVVADRISIHDVPGWMKLLPGEAVLKREYR